MASQPETNQLTKKLSIKECIRLMNCSQATVYNRAKKHGWEREQDASGNSFMHVPTADLDKYLDQPKLESSQSSSSSSQDLENIISKLEESYHRERQTLEESYDKERQLMAQQLEQLQKQVEELRQDKTTLNNQLGNTSQALIRVRDLEKQLDTERMKPWWRFW